MSSEHPQLDPAASAPAPTIETRQGEPLEAVCLACDYPLGVSSTCTECGRDVSQDREVAKVRAEWLASTALWWQPLVIIALATVAAMGVVAVVDWMMARRGGGDSMPLMGIAGGVLSGLVAVCLAAAGPAGLLAIGISRSRDLHIRLWLSNVWIMHLPWIGVLCMWAVLSLVEGVTRPKGQANSFLDEGIVIGGFGLWALICLGLVVWWITRITSQGWRLGINAFMTVRDNILWTIAGIVVWLCAALGGLLYGGGIAKLLMSGMGTDF